MKESDADKASRLALENDMMKEEIAQFERQVKALLEEKEEAKKRIEELLDEKES
jgi:hypothetical protein